MTARALLEQLHPWLTRRCAYVAAELPGLRADEVYQRAVEEFLASLERWLQEAPRVDVVAQARVLLANCVRHVKTAEIRERRRRHDVGEDEGEAFDELVPPVEPQDDAAAGALLLRVRACTTPPCALCLLSLRLPAVVVRDDAAGAKAWTKGGANAVPRAIEAAWDIYASGRDRPALVADDVRWKDHVGLAWYTDGPVDAVLDAERAAAAAKVERYANRGAEHLRTALLAERGEA